MKEKMEWPGMVTAVQPRIRLTRSFDQPSHTYLGYLMRIKGALGAERSEFRVGIRSGAHENHPFRVGDQVQGVGVRVADPRLEIADIYKISKLSLISRGDESIPTTLAWSVSAVGCLSPARASTAGCNDL